MAGQNKTASFVSRAHSLARYFRLFAEVARGGGGGGGDDDDDPLIVDPDGLTEMEELVAILTEISKATDPKDPRFQLEKARAVVRLFWVGSSVSVSFECLCGVLSSCPALRLTSRFDLAGGRASVCRVWGGVVGVSLFGAAFLPRRRRERRPASASRSTHTTD